MNHSGQPRYMQIYKNLSQKIATGEYGASQKLPSESKLSDEFQVSLITVKRALELLMTDGLITKVQGKGSFVNVAQAPKPKTGSKNIIGLVMEDFLAGYDSEIIRGAEEMAEKNGYRIVPLRTGSAQERETQAIDLLLDIGAVAIIIAPAHGTYYNEKILKLVLEDYPIVFLDRKLQGIPTASISSDNHTAGKKMIEHLFALGHKKIAIFSPKASADVLSDRLDGMAEAFAQGESGNVLRHNLTINHLNVWERDFSLACVALIEDFLQTTSCTAIACMNYSFALMAKKAIENLGKSVPEDYSIVCFDENHDVEGLQFFTHIRQQEFQMGSLCVEWALKKQRGEPFPSAGLSLDTQLVVCQSTAMVSQ